MKYPIGIQNFGEVRRNGYVYVDKTALMYKMVSEGKYYFLSRPRRSGNVEQFLQRLQSFFADFQYDAQTTPESHFRNVLYILCKLMGLQVDAEYQTSDGRIDLLLRTDKFVYIIECKIDSTARIALDQIKSKEYALPWSLDNRETILIGLNFSTTTRRPDDWIIERADGSIIEGGKNAREQEGEHDREHDEVIERIINKAIAKGVQLTPRQVKILRLIIERPSITAEQLVPEVGFSLRTVKTDLKVLRENGLIVRAGSDKKGQRKVEG